MKACRIYRRLHLLIYPLLLLFCTSCAQGLFFFPEKNIQYVKPKKDYQEIFYKDRGGPRLHAWLMPSRTDEAKAVIVHFHGNAQNLTSHHLFVSWLAEHGYHVISFDYRGFGKSSGTPSLTGAVRDGLTTLKLARNNEKTAGLPIIVLGQSIGAGLAATACGKYNPDGIVGLILDSPPSSFSRIAAEKLRQVWFLYPFSILTPLASGIFNNPDRYMKNITVPAFIFAGSEDQIVPAHHSEILYKRKVKGPRKIRILDGARHTPLMLVKKDILDFIESCLQP